MSQSSLLEIIETQRLVLRLDRLEDVEDIMEKIGMRHEGMLPQSRITRDKRVDDVWFGMLGSEGEAGRLG